MYIYYTRFYNNPEVLLTFSQEMWNRVNDYFSQIALESATIVMGIWAKKIRGNRDAMQEYFDFWLQI